MPRAREPTTRRILCTHCDNPLEIASGAKSVNCRYCHQRVITEPLVVKDYVAMRRLSVANRIRITKKGIVFSAVKADDLQVEGVLEGQAVAWGTIHLKKTARVKAALRARSLAVDVGAQLVGEMRIGPREVPEVGAIAEG